jgi:hypothetical protein
MVSPNQVGIPFLLILETASEVFQKFVFVLLLLVQGAVLELLARTKIQN